MQIGLLFVQDLGFVFYFTNTFKLVSYLSLILA